MEQNQTQTTRENASLWGIFALFVKKIKLVVVIAVLIAIVGGVLGGVLAGMNATYSTEFILYASPSDDNDSLLYALRSGKLNEKILFEENGLPPKAQCNEEDYEAAEKALKAYEDARALAKEKYEAVKNYYIKDIEQKYELLLNEYDQAHQELETYKNPQTEGVIDDNHKAMTAILEQNFLAAKKALQDYHDGYYVKAKDQEALLNKELTLAKQDADRKRDAANEAIEKATLSWQRNSAVVQALENLSKYVTFDYLKDDALIENENGEAEQKFNKKYIKVTISAPSEGEEAVEEIVRKYQQNLCKVVGEYVEDITDIPKSSCEITEFAIIVNREPDSLVTAGIKCAIACGIAAVALAFFVIAIHVMFKANAKNESQAAEDDGQDFKKEQN